MAFAARFSRSKKPEDLLVADAGRGHQFVERLRKQIAQRTIEKGNRKSPVGGQNPIGKGFVEAAVVGSFDESLTKPFVSTYKSITIVGDGFPGHWKLLHG